MRTEIEKQQTKRTIIHFSFQEREKKEKLISAAHPGRRRMAKFSHRVASHAPLEWRHTRHLNGADAAHLLVRVEHVPVTYRIKNQNQNVKILKHSP